MTNEEIKEAIAELFAAHAYCMIKGHRLVVNNSKILLRHKLEHHQEDIHIAKLDRKVIENGLTAEEWDTLTNRVAQIIQEVKKC